MKKIGMITLTIILAIGMIGFTGLDDYKNNIAEANAYTTDQIDVNGTNIFYPGDTITFHATDTAYITATFDFAGSDKYFQTSKYEISPQITIPINPLSNKGLWKLTEKTPLTDVGTSARGGAVRLSFIPVEADDIEVYQPDSPVINNGESAVFSMTDSSDYASTDTFNWYRLDSKTIIPDSTTWNVNDDGSMEAEIQYGSVNSTTIGDVKLDHLNKIDFDVKTTNDDPITEVYLQLTKKRPSGDYDSNNTFTIYAEHDTNYQPVFVEAGEYTARIRYTSKSGSGRFNTKITLNTTEYVPVGNDSTLIIEPGSENYKTSNKFLCMINGWQFTDPVSFSFPTPIITPDPPAPQNVTKITTPKSSITLKNKKSYTIPVKAYADGISKPNLIWKSSNPKIATVNQKGKVTAKKTGKVTITAAAENGKKIKFTIRVVKKNIKVKKISVRGAKKTIKKGKVAYLKVKTNPINATANKVTFKSSKKKVLTVDKYGKITAKKKGTAKVTVKAGGKKKVITIKVK